MAGEGRKVKPSCRSFAGRSDELANTYVFQYKGLMQTTSYSELRKNLSAMLDRVNADHEPVVITRDRGKPAAVLMSLEDFASYEETRYLLKSPANAARLHSATELLEQGGGAERLLKK